MAYNRLILQGNLTKKIELKELDNGNSIGTSSIAVNRKFKDSEGKQKEEVMFMDVVFFGKTAEIANQYLDKGSNVLLEGRVNYNVWTTEEGNTRSKHELIVEHLQMLPTCNKEEEEKKINPEEVPFS